MPRHFYRPIYFIFIFLFPAKKGSSGTSNTVSDQKKTKWRRRDTCDWGGGGGGGGDPPKKNEWKNEKEINSCNKQRKKRNAEGVHCPKKLCRNDLEMAQENNYRAS